MNKIKLGTVFRLTSLARKNVFYFSKDPFDKFNRKNKNKSSQSDNKQASEHKPEQHQKKKKQDTSSQHDEPNQERGKMDNFRGFNRFGQRKPQRENEQPVKENKHNTEQKGVEEEPEMKSTAFSKFQRRPKSPTHEPKKAEESKIKLNQAKKEEPQAEKKKSIPRVTVEFDENDQKQFNKIGLTKPKSKNRPNKSQTKAEELQKKVEQQQEHHPQLTPEQEQRWKQFNKRMQQIKQKVLFSGASRYYRQNLFKQTDKEKQFPQEPASNNLKDNFIKLVAAGLGLFFFSSVEAFLNRGKQVDADYLQTALREGRITQTWIDEVQVEGNNDEQTKGKNIHKSIYIVEDNGQVCFCASNAEFERQWFQMVIDYNHQIDIKANGLYQVPTTPSSVALDTEHHTEPIVKKVIIGEKNSSKDSSMVSTARSFLSLLLLFYFIKSITQLGKGRGGGAKGGGGGGLNLFENDKSYRFKEHIKVTFKDVVGMQKAKEEIVEFIDFLKNPDKYNRLGARIPKGALLTGPPGTGKTMIAKACAGESNVPFYTISGSEFIEMYVGVGAQRVRNIFKEAKQNSPSIIFIDEIDAVGKKRSSGFGGNDERDTTLNQLLVEMDGFDNSTNVIVFAATNQKEVLDPALTRPGRFDRLIDVELPDLEGRAEIFQVHLKPLVLDQKIDLKEYARRLATLTPGFSGADIKNVCNEAAIIAARNSKEFISIIDFELATERIIGGVEKKSQLITPQTRKTVAYHECGHGVVSWFLKHSNPLLKLTIIPRSKGALGFAQYLPNEHQIYTSDKLIDELCVILGGRVAEEVFFGKISTGASDDLNKAYQIAKTYVTQYGFGESLGWMQYDETEYAKDYSKSVENKIDEDIVNIMKVCSERTRLMIIEKKELIGNLAEKLLQVETIDQTIIEDILGPRPYEMSKQHKEYVSQKRRMSEEVKTQTLRQQAQAKGTKLEFKPSDYMF